MNARNSPANLAAPSGIVCLVIQTLDKPLTKRYPEKPISIASKNLATN